MHVLMLMCVKRIYSTLLSFIFYRDVGVASFFLTSSNPAIHFYYVTLFYYVFLLYMVKPLLGVLQGLRHE